MCILPLQVSIVSIFHKEQILIYQSSKLSSEKDDCHSLTMLLNTFLALSLELSSFWVNIFPSKKPFFSHYRVI